MDDCRSLTRCLWKQVSLLGLTIAFGISTSSAQVPIPGYPTDVRGGDLREMSMLPRYCIYTQGYRETVPGGNNPSEIARWYSVLGKTFHDMHHYCYGLIKTNRANFLVRNRRDRDFYLADAITEFDYVIGHAPPDFVLLPEIFTKKGENLLRLGSAPQGILELLRAIEQKPDYWPPYAALSDHFKQAKDLTKARQWLEKGLAASPDAKVLLQRLAELGGSKGPQPPSPPRTKPQPPAENAAPAPIQQPESPEPPAER
jgi:hypothetical protein